MHMNKLILGIMEEVVGSEKPSDITLSHYMQSPSRRPVITTVSDHALGCNVVSENERNTGALL